MQRDFNAAQNIELSPIQTGLASARIGGGITAVFAAAKILLTGVSVAAVIHVLPAIAFMAAGSFVMGAIGGYLTRSRHSNIHTSKPVNSLN